MRNKSYAGIDTIVVRKAGTHPKPETHNNIIKVPVPSSIETDSGEDQSVFSYRNYRERMEYLSVPEKAIYYLNRYRNSLNKIKKHREQIGDDYIEVFRYAKYLLNANKALKQRFLIGNRYSFVVSKNNAVIDSYGDEHRVKPANLAGLNRGDKITFLVKEMKRLFFSPDGKAHTILVLHSPLLDVGLTNIPQDNKQQDRSQDNIKQMVKDYGKHPYGGNAVCNICGKSFTKKQGYQIDDHHVFFCKDCNRRMFPVRHRGWRGRIISTPM